MKATIRRIAGIITARQGSFTGTPPAGQATYDAQGFFDILNGVPYAVKLVAKAPKRTTVGCDMIPAEVDDPCEIIVVGTKEFLFCPTEQIPVDEACP